MGDDLKELKSVLRSLVVSSPTQMDVRTLLRDYRNMMGAPVPLAKYGHRDPVAFLRERCSDCFVFGAPPSNPVLTLIVPAALKHIDQFVQKQKVSSTAKCKSKRRSIPEAVVNPPKENLIYKTYIKGVPTVIEEPKKPECIPPDNSNNTNNSKSTMYHNHTDNYSTRTTDHTTDHITSSNHNKENVENEKTVTSNDVKNFLMKRHPMYNSLHNFEETTYSEKGGAFSLSQDDDSGQHTSSSSNSTKALQLEELKSEIMELITAAPQGVWCTDLIRLYRERYKRELNFTRFGYTSIISLVYVLEQRVQITRPDDTGDWLLQERRRAAPAPPALRLARPRRACPARPARPARPALHDAADPDDALPGIDFDPDVFPEDCVHFMESIPSMSLADFRPGAMLEVIVGEVYSPSHFWLIRLGENYNIAMEDLMDEMTLYYNGEGRERMLARGAVRVGHYCSSLYENDWHRSLIVKIVDSDTVKVRHVDYGTVDTVPYTSLRPLRRAWAQLPAQAVRARLAAVRPSAAGRRWPHAAAAHFLRTVRDTRLVANIVAVDTETAECYLYPRFDALESGDTPNFAEIHAYLRDGIAPDYVQAYRQHVPLCLPADTPARAPPPPAPFYPPPAAIDPLPVAVDPLPAPIDPPPVDTPPVDTEPEPAELATRIPLLWPSASPPSQSSPAPSPTPASPAPAARTPPPPAPPGPAPRPSPPAPRAGLFPAPVFPLPPVFPPPPGASAPGQWFGPYPAPPSPYCAGLVTLSVAECETYRLLARSNPAAAHWYMAGALGRAMGAPPFPVHPPPAPMRPPPGFGG